jgi:hypothetical protein
MTIWNPYPKKTGQNTDPQPSQNRPGVDLFLQTLCGARLSARWRLGSAGFGTGIGSALLGESSRISKVTGVLCIDELVISGEKR